MTRRLRRLAAYCLLIGMLSGQYGVAAFACPLVGGGGEAPAMPAVHEGCAGTHAASRTDPAPVDAALCGLHCQSSVSVPSAPPPPVAIVESAPLKVAVHDAALGDGPHDGGVTATAMATAPPASILYCRIQV